MTISSNGLQVAELRKECAERKIPHLGEDKPTLQRKLDSQLAGIKRPLALLGNDDDLTDCLQSYAVCQLEPLHDLKTTICKSIIKQIGRASCRERV